MAPEDVTREERYEHAKAREVPGRSWMTKQELAEHFGEGDDEEQGQPVASRFEAFRSLAQAQTRARGESVFLPRMLTGEDRRLPSARPPAKTIARGSIRDGRARQPSVDELAGCGRAEPPRVRWLCGALGCSVEAGCWIFMLRWSGS